MCLQRSLTYLLCSYATWRVSVGPDCAWERRVLGGVHGVQGTGASGSPRGRENAGSRNSDTYSWTKIRHGSAFADGLHVFFAPHRNGFVFKETFVLMSITSMHPSNYFGDTTSSVIEWSCAKVWSTDFYKLTMNPTFAKTCWYKGTTCPSELYY